MPDNYSPSIRRNFFYNTLLQVVILLIPFFTTPYVSRVLGADNIGIYSYSLSIATYFMLFAILGSNTYGQRKVAFIRDNKDSLTQVFWNVFFFRFMSSILFCVLYFCFVYYVKDINIVSIIVGLNFLDIIVNISWFYQGVEEFKRITIRNLLVRIVMLILIFALVNDKNDLWIYVLIIVLSSVFGNVAMWVSLPKYIGFPNEIHPFDSFKEIWLIFLPSIAIQVYTVLDKSMIGWITESNYYNGCYEQSERIARLAITIVTSVGTVILPRVANLYKKSQIDDLKNYIYKAYRVVWLISIPMMFGLIAVSSVFIPLFLGPGFDLSILLLQIFSILIVVVSLAYITGLSYLVPTEQQNIYTISVTVAAVVNFLLNLIMIRRFGAIGAAYSSIVAESVGVGFQLFYCIQKKQLSFSKIFLPSINYWVASVLMFLIVVTIKQFLTNSVISLVLLIFVGVVTYSLFLIILRDSFFINNSKSLISNTMKGLR